MAIPDFDGVYSRVIELQRQIHQDPETGFDTVRTAQLVARELRECGLEPREGVGRTGVIADLKVDGASRCIALRADMDALPMDEDNDLPHRSRTPGKAHLCGHDAHTAMLLGAARLLSARQDLPCSVRFIFQPNEEALPGGAPAMIADGCLEGVDRIFGMHVWPDLETGRLGVLPGPAMAQPDTFHIRLRGVGGHAAAPSYNRDPVVAAAHIVTAAQTIVARNIDPLDSAVLSVTQIHTGTADNVIPERAELRGTIRSFRPEVGEKARTRLVELAGSIAKALEVEAEVDVTIGYPVLVNDGDACDEVEAGLASTIPITRQVSPSLGGEDFAYYLREVPGAFMFLGNYDEAQDIRYFCHHPRFRVDDQAMAHGLRCWVSLVTNARRT